MSDKESSYRRILKTSSIIGGASFISILIGMVRTKFVALLLGPAGIGLMGMFGTITGMIGSFSGMGLATSGVRKIAESHGANDQEKISRSVKTLRLTVWFTGTLGMLIAMLGSYWWSKISFGSTEYTIAITLLGITVLLDALTVGQSCILQGTRRIADLAKINIIGAIVGTLVSIPCFYLWGTAGIVPSLVLFSIAKLMISWRFVRRIPINQLNLSWGESRGEAIELLSFGFPLMLSSLGGTLTAYVIRLIIMHKFGIEGVGSFLAAYTLSGVIVNFVLGAMGADYYPRLVAIASDNQKIAYEVNAQTEIGLLLALPGLAATLIFAPIIIGVFYSSEFNDVVGILRWLVFGIYGRIVLWPIGYVILAKGKSKTTLWAETLNDSVWILLTWVCVQQWGLNGAGIAFALLYIFSTGLFLMITKIIANMTWTLLNFMHILGMGALLIIIAANCHFSPDILYTNEYVSPIYLQWSFNLTLLIFISIYCLRRLLKITGVSIKMILYKWGLLRKPGNYE